MLPNAPPPQAVAFSVSDLLIIERTAEPASLSKTLLTARTGGQKALKLVVIYSPKARLHSQQQLVAHLRLSVSSLQVFLRESEEGSPLLEVLDCRGRGPTEIGMCSGMHFQSWNVIVEQMLVSDWPSGDRSFFEKDRKSVV